MNGENIRDLNSEHSITLRAFSRALRREAHVLTEHPDILWQQMYNRLQWEEAIVQQSIRQELSRQNTSPASPWFWLKTPHHESTSLSRTLNCKSSVSKCLFSPDGNFIVSQAGWMTQIWDVGTGELIRTIDGSAPAFSPDGRWIAATGEDQGVCIWEAATGLLKHSMKGYTEGIRSSAFSPDGSMIASACTDYTARVWDANTGSLLHVLDHNYNNVTSCAFSPKGPLIVTGSENGRLKVWDKYTGQVIRAWYGHNPPGGVTDCSFSPNGQLIISAGADETVRIWDSETGKPLHTLDDHGDRVYACAFSPDGNLIVTACDDKKVRLYESTTGKLLSVIVGHTHFAVACSFSPDGRWIISGSHDNTVRVWDTHGKHGGSSREHHDAKARACVFSPDGKLIASSGDDRSVRLWEAETGNTVKVMECHAELEVEDCAFSPDGHSIVSAGWDGTLRVSDIATGDTLHTLKGHTGSGYATDGRLIIGAVRACNYSPLGDLIVSGGRDKTIRLWNADTGELLRTLEGHPYDVSACGFSPDGGEIISASGETLRIWDAVSGKVIRDLNLPNNLGSFESCVFSPDGNLIISAKGKILGVWDFATGQVIRILYGHTDIIKSCDVSPDGHWIVSASVDGAIRVWNLYIGKMVALLLLPGLLHCIRFHPYVPKLVCCDAGGAVYRLEVVGLTYGSIVVTASQGQQGFEVRCPACQQRFPIGKDRLGREMTCPTEGCGLRLKVNPFVIHRI